MPRYWPSWGSVTSGFGPRWGSFHDGIDLGADCGTPIWAAQRGTVIAAGPASGYGNWVRIDHGGGTVTEYGHMFSQDLLVSVGQWVTDGQQIARVGTAGNSTGCHLHFEVQINGTSIDPVPWLADAIDAEDRQDTQEDDVAQIDLDRIAQIFWENFNSWDVADRPGWLSYANEEGDTYRDLPMGYDRWTDAHLTSLIETGREQDRLLAELAGAVAAQHGVEVDDIIADVEAAFDEVSAELPVDVRVNITGTLEPEDPPQPDPEPQPNPDQALLDRLTTGDSHGNVIRLPQLALDAARAAGCDLAAACVVLILETSGGQNIYGHDSTTCTDLPYVKGGPVTEANYAAYKDSREACGNQGVGPVQLTWIPFQDEADARGGCWRADISTRYGFELLAGYITDGGFENAFRTYNGTQRYADAAMALLPEWQQIVTGA